MLMDINIKTGKTKTISEEFVDSSITYISDELSRYGNQITRVNVHLSDENGIKQGLNDKRCMVEARLAGLRPIAVIDVANTYEQAVFGAIHKLKTSLETITGRLKNY